jgi:two-component SAPR family response regulator
MYYVNLEQKEAVMNPHLYPQVVLVDDEPLTVRGYSLMLQDFFRVIAFTDPLEALAYFEEEKPEDLLLIISDARMPDLPGTDLLHKAAHILPGSQRIMVSAAKDFEVAKEAVNRGKVHCFLTKPLHPILLINVAIASVEQVLVRRIREQHFFVNQLTPIERNHLDHIQQVFQEVDCVEYEKHPRILVAYQEYYRCLHAYRTQRIDRQCLETVFHPPAINDKIVGSIHLRQDMLRAALLLEKAGQTEENFHEQKEWMAEAGVIIKETAHRMAIEQLNGIIPLLVDTFPELMAWGMAKSLFSTRQKTLIEACQNKTRRMSWIINTLGPLTITYEGQAIDAMSLLKQKESKLLTFLLSRAGKRTPVEVLLETFWPDKSEKQGLNSLYQILHTLRRILEPDLDQPKDSRLIRYQDRYCWLDATQARIEDLTLTKEMDIALEQWQAGKTEAFLTTCQALAQMYHNPYLNEWQYEDWITDRRNEIRMKWQKILFHYVNVLVNQDRFQEAQLILASAIQIGLVAEEMDQQFLWKHEGKS